MGDWLNELRYLHQELSLLKRPLEGLLSRVKGSDRYKELQRNIRMELDDIEDTIAKCMNTHMTANKGTLLGQLFTTTPRKESSIDFARVVKEIRINKLPLLRKYLGRLSNLPEDAADRAVTEAIRLTRRKKTKHIVGFEEDTAHMINRLNSESSQLKVVAIVGMAGLGKTTLAWKVFEDPIIKNEFPIRIWVDISDVYNKKNVCLTILENSTADAADLSNIELTEMVKERLKDEKFLIVMDDIWTSSIWDDIKCILPMDNKISRVLITTRDTDVATHAMDSKMSIDPITSHTDVVTNAYDEAHYLRFLTVTESWEIFQYVVFDKLNVVPEELVVLGKVIVSKCDGHALSIVVIGEILKTNRDSEDWKNAISSLNDHLFNGDSNNILSSISLSYKTLSFELRTCLLYLGVFPEDSNIPVNRLLRLWIAEGLIQETVGKSLEISALENLKVLISRNLVMVEERKVDGAPKACRIHNSVREFCKEEAKFENLNLFKEITKLPSEEFEAHENIEKFRRLCIHSHVLDFLRRNKNVSQVRSFLSFPRHPMVLVTVDMESVIDGFNLLRVYDAPKIKFQTFPQKFAQLLHLRYLILVLEQCTSLPEVIADLWNLQTLIIDVSSDTVEIRADIWAMRQLRHLKTKASITLIKDGTGTGGNNLQTLSRLSPESCTREVVEKAKKLITLGIQGELDKLAAPDGFAELNCLLKLKLVNKVSNGVAAEKPYHIMRFINHPPPCLKILVLNATYIPWKEMSLLSKLRSLEVLKLKENAFVGKLWPLMDTFDCLKRLHIETATDLSTWEATNDSFPELKILVLYNCERLSAVPSVVCKNLDLLCMERVTENAVSCAQEIHRETQKKFKLEIALGDLNRMY